LFDNFPTIEVGFRQEIGNFISPSNNTNFVNTEPFVIVEYDFLKYFDFKFDYTKSNYQNKDLGQKNTYEIANASLSYKNEDSAWSFSI
jgi:hypothetical protein